ncbi:MAG TPA: hypothetical protein VND68_07020 [Chloroflexia bacterium]|nr:hypothetical protein [Chloroflexia bacterium]
MKADHEAKLLSKYVEQMKRGERADIPAGLSKESADFARFVYDTARPPRLDRASMTQLRERVFTAVEQRATAAPPKRNPMRGVVIVAMLLLVFTVTREKIAAVRSFVSPRIRDWMRNVQPFGFVQQGILPGRASNRLRLVLALHYIAFLVLLSLYYTCVTHNQHAAVTASNCPPCTYIAGAVHFEVPDPSATAAGSAEAAKPDYWAATYYARRALGSAVAALDTTQGISLRYLAMRHYAPTASIWGLRPAVERHMARGELTISYTSPNWAVGETLIIKLKIADSGEGGAATMTGFLAHLDPHARSLAALMRSVTYAGNALTH